MFDTDDLGRIRGKLEVERGDDFESMDGGGCDLSTVDGECVCNGGF